MDKVFFFISYLYEWIEKIKLYKGVFGKVYRAESKLTGDEVAIKVIKKRDENSFK